MLAHSAVAIAREESPRGGRRRGAWLRWAEPGSTAALLGIGVATGTIPSAPFQYFAPVELLPVLAVILTTWLASWVGSRRDAGGVAHGGDRRIPRALGGCRVQTAGTQTGSPLRCSPSAPALLLLGALIGLANPLGVLVGLLGGIFSFTGVVLGPGCSSRPPCDSPARLLGRGPTGRLAAENAVRYSRAQHAHHDRRRDRRRARDDVRGRSWGTLRQIIRAAQEQRPSSSRAWTP